MVEIIQSLQNPRVKEWTVLLTKKGREKSGQFLVEGVHLVSEALRSECEVQAVLYVPGSAAEEELLPLQIEQDGRSGPWIPVSEAVMTKITDAVTPQGVAAVVRFLDTDLEQLFSTRSGSYVAVDAVQDPGNLGTIIRSADAVGAAGVLLGAGTVDLYNPKTVRATMGSIFHIPVIPCDLLFALPLAAAQGVKIVATSLAARKNCFEADLTGSVCFLVGNEGAGVSSSLIKLAHETVIIPIPGKAESLNVSTATTVLLYETLRQQAYSKHKD